MIFSMLHSSTESLPWSTSILYVETGSAVGLHVSQTWRNWAYEDIRLQLEHEERSGVGRIRIVQYCGKITTSEIQPVPWRIVLQECE